MMSILSQTKELCREYGVQPSRSRGQNFLVCEDVYDMIIDAAGLDENDTVLEVGPGLGFLTERLARYVKKVIAVELDDKLVRVLQDRLGERGYGNVEVIRGDVLYISSCRALTSDYKVVANLPYNITSIFLRKYLSETDKRPDMMVLMLQKEVAERITAQPGKMSLLAVSVQFYAEPEIIEVVPRDCFWPEPEVDSAIVRIKKKIKDENEINEKHFFRLVRIGFSARRKMLKNNLAGGYRISHEEAARWLKLAGLRENCRAQELSVNDWAGLSGFMNKKSGI